MGEGMQVEGLVARPLEHFGYDDCRAVDERYQVGDVGELVREGRGPALDGDRGLRFMALMEAVGPELDARWVTLEAGAGGFAASLPIEEVALDGVILYERDGAPLTAECGGPFRLLIPGYRDECADLAGLARIVFADEPGRDTRASRGIDPCLSPSSF